MRILISALGSRGDIQPYLALAVGLQQAGHPVTFLTSQSFAGWIESYGVATRPVRFDLQELTQRPAMREVAKSRNLVRRLRVMRQERGTGVDEVLSEYWEAGQEADFVLQTGTGHGGVEVASHRGIPMAFAILQPVIPTRAFPSYFLPVRFSLGGGYNYLTHLLVMRATWPYFGEPLNRWRTTRLGLPPWRSHLEMLMSGRSEGTPLLFGYSPSVLPKPTDWDASQHVTGYWFLDALPDWQPPADLLRFLESGPPPVYLGFGSMHDGEPERVTRLALRALELSGQRGVLVTGWGGITRLPTSASVFYVDSVPHDWLFPRMAATVHHGGAGTTAAALRAGVPSIITPFAFDQYAWGEQVARLGVGLNPAPIAKLTAEKLAAAIHAAVNNPTMRARAAALGEKIRAEKGVEHAIELIERHAARFTHA